MKLVCLLTILLLIPTLVVGQTPIPHTVDENFDGAWCVYATDVDGDGDTDVLGVAYFGDDITWWENEDGIGHNWVEHTVDEAFDGARDLYAADVDGDNDIDMLGAGYFADDITWWENEDGSGLNWVEHTVAGDFDGASGIYAADVDGDGDTDILGAATSADDITWWENVDGSGLNWVEHTVDDNSDGAWDVYAEDVDGDGDIDVLGAIAFADDIAWWENVDGDGLTWIERTVSGDFNNAQSVYATDMDSDGDVDVLGAAYSGSDIAWWENVDGDGTSWTLHMLSGGFNGACSVYALDMDNDGDSDVLGAAVSGDDITWWENVDGGGLEWTGHTVDGSFDGAHGVFAADIDGYGHLDIIGAASEADEITWWEIPGPVQLTPGDDPVTVTPGGSFDYTVDIVLEADEPFFGAIWSEAVLPNGNTYGPIYDLDFFFGTLTDIHVEGIIQQVPLIAPLGDYVFVLYIGLNPDNVLFSEYFLFSVVEADARMVNSNDPGWVSQGHERLVTNEVAQADASVLTGFALQPVYPNPFNSTATITVSMANTAELGVVVLDVMGRQVAQLANGQFDAGNHTLTFDASGLVSGLYLVRATIPGQMDQVRKVMLVR